MGRVVRFKDDNSACWARVDWESGEPAFISIAQSGVLIKRSRLGLFGTILYSEPDIHSVVAMSRVIDDHILDDSIVLDMPPGLNSPVLCSFTSLAVATDSAISFCASIGEAKRLVAKGE